MICKDCGDNFNPAETVTGEHHPPLCVMRLRERHDEIGRSYVAMRERAERAERELERLRALIPCEVNDA